MQRRGWYAIWWNRKRSVFRQGGRIDQEQGSYIRLERRWKTGDRITAEYTYDYHVPENMAAVLEIPEGNPEKAIEHISGLGFRTREGILLKPLYDTHHRRYIVYWNVVGK